MTPDSVLRAWLIFNIYFAAYDQVAPATLPHTRGRFATLASIE